MNKLFLLSLLYGRLVAQPSCDLAVVDDARVLDIAQVTAAAQALDAAGADVRVRTYTSLGSWATIDRLKDFTQAQCPSWQASDGGMKNNLVVLAVAVTDHKVGLYYGSLWKPILDSRWNRVQSEQMKPRFRDRDFTGGFAAGMKSIQGLIAAADSPITSATPVIVQPAAPTDFSGLWQVMRWSLGLVALGVATWGLFALLVGRRKKRESASASRQGAIIAQQEVVGLITNIGANLPSWEIVTTDKARVSKATTLFNGASSRYSTLKQSSSVDPDQDGLTTGQYESIRQSYEGLLNDLREADYLMTHVGDPPRASRPAFPARRTQAPTPKPAASASSVPPSSSNTNTMIFVDSERSDPGPSYHSTPSKSESGGSSSWGVDVSSSSSGGSSDWGSSSSDSGGSSDSGSSDSGGGSSDF